MKSGAASVTLLPADVPLWQRPWAQAAAIVVLVLVAFSPGLRGVYTWDDEDCLVNNPTVHSPTGLVPIWTDVTSNQDYYPLVFTTFWIEYRLWGVDPLGYHVVNALLHAGGAVAFFFLLRRLGLKSAWAIAAIWAVHPLQVESVTWVVERKNVLSGVLFFGSIVAYLRFARIGGGVARQWRWWVIAMLCFIAALLSKPLTCTLPAVLLILLYWKLDRLRWRDLWPAMMFFVPAAAIALVQIWVQRHHVGALGPEFAFGPVERVLIAGRAVWFYLWKTLVPYPLMQIHPRFVIDAAAAWQYLFPAAVVAGLVALWLFRRRFARGPIAAALCYLVILSPALGFFSFYTMLYTFVADHYQYLALGAILALVVEAGAHFMGRYRHACLMLVLGLSIVLTMFYASLYQSESGLWEFNRVHNPNSFMVLNNLGTALLNDSLALSPYDPERGDYERGGVAALRHAASLAPRDPRAYTQLVTYAFRHKDPELFAFAYDGLVNCPPAVAGQGRSQIIGESVRAAGGDLNFFLGQIYESRNEPDRAVEYYQRNLRDYPRNAKALVGLARIAAATGRVEEAVQLFERARQIDPTLGPSK